MGFTLDEIQHLLTLRVQSARRCEHVKRSAATARERVQERLAALQRMDAILERLMHACDARQVTAECPILEALEPEGRM